MPELKPCPFCGAKVQLSDPKDSGSASNTIMVMCSRCPGRVESIYDWADGDEAQAEEYIASVWNRRADSEMRKAAQADGFKTGAKHMKKVYIAHPLRGGTRDINIILRNLSQADERLRLLSAEYDDILFLSPLHAFSFVSPLGPQEWVLGQCRAMLDLCDELWVFGKWEASEGCRMEVEYARELGLTVVFEDVGKEDNK